MNKTSVFAPNSSESVQKDTSNSTRRSGQGKDSQSEPHEDDPDKEFLPKDTSHFDYSSLGLFFNEKPSHHNTTTEGVIGKAQGKQRSSERSSSKDSNAMQQPSSKDFSNLRELMENTTIIPNSAETSSQQAQQGHSDTRSRYHNDDRDGSNLLRANSLEKALFRNDNRNNSKEKTASSKNCREDKMDQEIAADISKLNMDDEQEKGEVTRFKVPKTKLPCLERIMTKSSSQRYGYAVSYELENSKQNESQEVPLLNTSAGSVFASLGLSRIPKAVSPIILQYQDNDLCDEDKNVQEKIIAELFENYTRKSIGSEDIPLDKSKEISQEDLLPRLLTEKSARESLNNGDSNPDSSKVIVRKKHNLSLVSTDSTIDSENLTMAPEPQNNSFSTPYSGANGSFSKSGKTEFDSPTKTDPGIISGENAEGYLKAYSMQKNMGIGNQKMTNMSGQRQVTLGQNYMSFCGGYGSGNKSDRSTYNEEYGNNFNTPQVNQQQQQQMNQSFNMSSRSGMREQFFIAPRNMMNQGMGQSNTQERQPFPFTKSGNFTDNDSKNSGRMRRKTNQDGEDESLYEIDPDKIEYYGRTTLMVRNIPNKYDLTLILQTIDKNFKGKFDFFYLPIDFSNRCNFGYAFINFMDTKYIKDFYNEFNGKKWEKFNSEKICQIRYARIQGYTALMQHFEYSRVMNQQDKKLRPYIPTKYGIQNKQKIEELVRQQKLASSHETTSIRQYK